MSGFLHQDRVRVPRAPGRVEGWVIVGLVVAACGAVISQLLLARWHDRDLPVEQRLPA